MKKCELLVPVGGEKQLIAAVENGADAVYLGGRAFNARINAGNFDDREISRAIDFAHQRGVKIYVTMNTLLTEEELEDTLRYGAFLYEIGADALIVQDMGFGLLMRENLPDFPLHLSTQASVYDLRGVEAAYRLGYERVVLARELSLAEIGRICSQASAEIEVFVHGALCFCYSGQCQMSRAFGGRSGNRGQCAQPCRLPYETLDRSGKKVDTFRYPLSPKDLCLIERLPDLARAGVASLKIEGRMKSPEYVAVDTSIYRKYLDLYERDGGYTVSQEDILALQQIFNRGGFTEGYADGDPGPFLMAGDIPKHRGVRIGKTIKRIRGTELIDVELNRELSIGDGVEIQGEKPIGNVVTYCEKRKNGPVRIGDIKGEVEPGAPVYRITSKAQLSAARSTFEHKTYEEGKFIRKTDVDMIFSCTDEGVLRLRLTASSLKSDVVVQTGPFDLERGKGTDPSRIEKALNKTGGTPFRVGKIRIMTTGDMNIPVSRINDIRRQGLEKLTSILMVRRTAPVIHTLGREEQASVSASELFFFSWEGFCRWRLRSDRETAEEPTAVVLPLVEFMAHREELVSAVQNIIPYITNISRGKEDDFIEEHFDRICEEVRECGIYIGNLSWIQPFRAAGVPVYGDYGLNVCNSAAAAAYAGLGVIHCVDSLEITPPDRSGNFPLMISRHCPDGDALVDRKGEKVFLLKRNFSDQTLLLSSGEFSGCRSVKPAQRQSGRVFRMYLK